MYGKMYANIIMIIKIFVVSILLITIITIIAGWWLLLNIKEGMREIIDKGQYNLPNNQDFTPLDLTVNGIPQSSSITEFAKSCVEKGPPDIATLLITGSSGDYAAYYSKVRIDPDTAYSKIKTSTELGTSPLPIKPLPVSSTVKTSNPTPTPTPTPTPVAVQPKNSVKISSPKKTQQQPVSGRKAIIIQSKPAQRVRK